MVSVGEANLTDFRETLKKTFIERKTKNSVYSLRAFARDLKISPAFLSQVLNGRRSLGPEKSIELCKRLNLTKNQTNAFIAQVRLSRLADPERRADLLKEISRLSQKPSSFANLELDKFLIISDWYHFSILELTTVQDFIGTPEWIAERLGISKYAAELALSRLLRLKLLEKTASGKLKKAKDFQLGSTPSSAIRKYHGQMIEKAKASIEGQSFEQRDISGITFSIDPSQLPEAKARIKRFREEMNEFFEQGKKQKVYQMCIQLFQLDTK